jgi:hypothetical protein
MATLLAANILSVSARDPAVRCGVRRRMISPEAGRALEILGHAIEYLADEYAHRAERFSAHDGEVAALQLLMRVNRQIYFDCPEVPSMIDRWRGVLHLRTT